MEDDKYYRKIDVPAGHWVPTIVKVENGYVLEMKTPSSSMNITENYVYSNWSDVVEFLTNNFEEQQE